MKEPHILIVDDDQGVRNLYAEVFRNEPYRVSLCESAGKGLEMLGRDAYDLVILDIQMPDMDGFGFLAALKKKFETLPPVIVSTGMGTVENAVRAVKNGASDFIVKPFNVANLLQVVERNLKIKSLSDEISELQMVQSILDLNQVIMSLAELDPLLERIIGLVWDLFSPESVRFYLTNEDGDHFILRKLKYRGDHPREQKISYSLRETAELFAGKPVAVLERGEGRETLVPIEGKDRKIGILALFSADSKVLNPREIKFMKAFASQAGIGIENARLLEMVNSSYINAIRSLVNSLEAKDAYTKGHSEQVAYYTVLVGKKLGFTERQLELLRNTAYLHDLGKLGIKDSILLKPTRLTDEELRIIRKHPDITVEILEPLSMKKEELEACLYHHERMDGKGYPKGLKGKEIPLYARIISVADAFSAMISERPYSKAMKKEEAIEELKRNAGTQFDPEIVEVFLHALELSTDRASN